jgi:adenosylhomocysteinase
VNAYFSDLVGRLEGDRSVKAVVVAHAVPNSVLFLPYLDKLVDVVCVLPKPGTVGTAEFHEISKMFNTRSLTREWASTGGNILEVFSKVRTSTTDVILVDIGGYFANSAREVHSIIGKRLLGVLEGTENGLQRYEGNARPEFPLISVARSPLKLPEDYLVASSVVFSIEAILRDEAEVLQTRAAAVLGYGRVGSAIADILRGRGINTVVFDKDPVQLAKAAARGFQAHTTLLGAVGSATLVVCATGNKSISGNDFVALKEGTVVASVTSADDELDTSVLKATYKRQFLSKDLTRYDSVDSSGHYILMVADGNAANFVHRAVIGPAIQLIEGEKLAAVSTLIQKRLPAAPYSGPAFYEVDAKLRQEVASVWNSHFLTA